MDDFTNLFVSESVKDTIFTITDLSANTTYHWRVFATNIAGGGNYSEVRQFTTAAFSAVERKISSIPKRYALLPAYPNPFNPTTRVTYHLPEKADVFLIIYNSMGQSVQERVSGNRDAGEYLVTWDGKDNCGTPVTSGLYICLFKAASRVLTQKIMLMR